MHPFGGLYKNTEVQVFKHVFVQDEHSSTNLPQQFEGLGKNTRVEERRSHWAKEQFGGRVFKNEFLAPLTAYSPATIPTTRRFLLRPSAVSFGATGARAPYHRVTIRS